MICQVCQKEIPDGTRFCPECGSRTRNINCINCGAEITPTVKFCPGCGRPIAPQSQTPTYQPAYQPTYHSTYTEPPKKKKKKHPILGTILLIFGILLILGVIAGDPEPQKVGETGTTAIVQPMNNKFSVGDKVELGGIVVTLVNVSESTGGNYMTPEAGKVFIICEFTIENNSASDIAVSSLMCFEAYIDDYSTMMDLSATVSSNKTQLDGTVAAGKKMNGIIGYSADKGWQELEIRFTPDFWSGSDIIFSYTK